MYVFFIIIGLLSVLVLSTRKKIINRPDNDNHFDCDKDEFVADFMRKQSDAMQVKSDGRIKVID